MKDLIEAFTIFAKYSDSKYPTNCIHDELIVCVDPKLVSAEDIARLDELGFIADDEGEYYEGCFSSFRFGSC